MNSDNRMDERWIQQVDDRLESGKRSDYPVVNLLAEMLSSAEGLPQAEATFRDDLEARLVAQLQQRHQQKEARTMIATRKLSARPHFYSYMTWAAALIVIVLMGSYVLMQRAQPALPSAMQVQTAVPLHTIVIATQNIEAGTMITDDMVGIVSLSALDFDKLQSAQPDRLFFSDVKAVVGQLTNTTIFRFQPIEPVKLGQAIDCPRTDLQCIAVPNGLHTISLPLPIIGPDTLGLVAGDHVDVFASVNNQIAMIVEDVVITNVQTDKITFAATSWKLSVLIWLWRSKQSYTLSLHRGEAPARDEQIINFGFTSPEPLPDNYKFHLTAGLSDSQGYQLIGAPYSLDSIQFTQHEDRMEFWFTNLKVVSITNGTNVIISLPMSDAALLGFLLKKGATLEFIPQ
jgi:flagella basal body P-ring formation protein FlgA